MLGWRFDFYYSLAFWGALIVAAAAVRLAGRSPRARGAVLLASSCALLLAIPRFGPVDLAIVLAEALAALAAVQRLLRPDFTDPGRRRLVTAAAVGAVLAVLGWFKYRFLQDVVFGRPAAGGGASEYVFLIGVSYFSFKAIHVVVEASKRTLTAVQPLAFLNYMVFFPAFVSGPINRYPHFAEQLATPAASPLGSDLRAGAERILHGLFKKLVLVPLVFPYALASQPPVTSDVGVGTIAVGLYASALYFYFDFAAYSDLAVGAARVMGFTLPENFNWPFLQRNIRELWTNWHMSLTSWLVDYVYWPVVRRLRNLNYFRTRPVLLSIVGMNATFLACGAWHGEAANFLLWGAYHGIGISVLNVYQREKKRIRHPLVQRWFRSRASRVAGAVGTFHFFAAGLALFVLDLDRLRALAGALLR